MVMAADKLVMTEQYPRHWPWVSSLEKHEKMLSDSISNTGIRKYTSLPSSEVYLHSS
jgi:hypothetical protein